MELHSGLEAVTVQEGEIASFCVWPVLSGPHPDTKQERPLNRSHGAWSIRLDNGTRANGQHADKEHCSGRRAGSARLGSVKPVPAATAGAASGTLLQWAPCSRF